MVVEIKKPDWSSSVNIFVGKFFTDIAVMGSSCNDTIKIESTRLDTRSIEVYGGEGTDTVVIGSEVGDLDERPVHNVCLSSFKIAKYEVRQKFFQTV